MEFVQQRRQPVIAGVALGAEPQHALHARRHPAQVVFGAAEIVEHPPRGGQHPFTRGRRQHAPAQTHEELQPGTRFEIEQLVTESRLRQVEPLGGTRDGTGLGDRVDQRQVFDFEHHHHETLS